MTDEQKELINTMEEGASAELVLSMLDKWYEAYQKYIIARLKQCKSDELEGVRCLLTVSDDFKAYLTSIVNDGKLAESDFKFIEETQANLNKGSFYPE